MQSITCELVKKFFNMYNRKWQNKVVEFDKDKTIKQIFNFNDNEQFPCNSEGVYLLIDNLPYNKQGIYKAIVSNKKFIINESDLSKFWQIFLVKEFGKDYGNYIQEFYASDYIEKEITLNKIKAEINKLSQNRRKITSRLGFISLKKKNDLIVEYNQVVDDCNNALSEYFFFEKLTLGYDTTEAQLHSEKSFNQKMNSSCYHQKYFE